MGRKPGTRASDEVGELVTMDDKLTSMEFDAQARHDAHDESLLRIIISIDDGV